MWTQKGFTLIEVMIVVAIVAIIAAIALPSYQSSVSKSRRTDAKSALTEIAAAQEKQYFKNNEYSSDLTALYGGAVSKEGFYSLTVDLSGCADNQCFTIKATAQGAQAGDTDCKTYTIDHTGARTAANAGGTATTATCW